MTKAELMAALADVQDSTPVVLLYQRVEMELVLNPLDVGTENFRVRLKAEENRTV